MKDLNKKYFKTFTFTLEQKRRNYQNALKDLKIAKEVDIIDVKFNYTYTALIKAGIALLSFSDLKIKGIPGHHIKIIDQTARILKDKTITDVGNVMRSKRNAGFYDGGSELTIKECKEYLAFTADVVKRVKERLPAK